MSATLRGEMERAFARLEAASCRQLDALGVPRWAIMGGLVGVETIRRDRDCYEPDPHGARCYVTPVRIDDAQSPESPDPARAVRFGEIVDLVAWRPDAPDSFATRSGAAAWLGAIEPQYCFPAPVKVWRGVLGWLRGGADGLVLLTTAPSEIWQLLIGLHAIEAEDRRHQTELGALLARPWPAPRIWAADRMVARAA